MVDCTIVPLKIKMDTSSKEKSTHHDSVKKRVIPDSGSMNPIPLCVTPRPPLRQKYISERNGKFCENFRFRSDEVQFTQLKTKEDSLSNIELKDDGGSTRSFILLLLIFLTAVGLLTVVYLNFPKLAQEEKQHIKLPRDIEDAKNLGKVLSRYTDKYYMQVLSGYFVTYIFLQSFAIPGSIFLSILSGFLFPFFLALFMVCLCSGIGATFCYLLSYLVGRRLVIKYIPEKVADWQSHVNHHREHLLNYIIFLRITPFLPNWFINIASPVINVPLVPFFIGTFLGVAPPSFVAIQAGTTLHQLTSSGDAVSYRSMIVLAIFALVSLLPVVFKKKLKAKFD